jgi:hypothetical protein
MSRLLNRLAGSAMSAFVADGVGLDDDGRILLPDGLTAPRVHRFIELCVDASYDNPRDAIHDLFRRVGVSSRAIRLLNDIIHEGGGVDMAAGARQWRRVTGSLRELHEIPGRFRSFLVDDLELADPDSATLELAVASTRRNAAQKLGCKPDWDAILACGGGVSELTAGWRDREAG